MVDPKLEDALFDSDCTYILDQIRINPAILMEPFIDERPLIYWCFWKLGDEKFFSTVLTERNSSITISPERLFKAALDNPDPTALEQLLLFHPELKKLVEINHIFSLVFNRRAGSLRTLSGSFESLACSKSDSIKMAEYAGQCASDQDSLSLDQQCFRFIIPFLSDIQLPLPSQADYSYKEKKYNELFVQIYSGKDLSVYSKKELLEIPPNHGLWDTVIYFSDGSSIHQALNTIQIRESKTQQFYDIDKLDETLISSLRNKTPVDIHFHSSKALLFLNLFHPEWHDVGSIHISGNIYHKEWQQLIIALGTTTIELLRFEFCPVLRIIDTLYGMNISILELDHLPLLKKMDGYNCFIDKLTISKCPQLSHLPIIEHCHINNLPAGFDGL